MTDQADPRTFATTLLVIGADKYDLLEFLSWSPQTIAMELHDDFQVDVPQRIIDRIMAAISIVGSDDFYHRLPVFNHICNVLSGDMFDPATFEPATVDEIAWGVTEAALLWPPEDGETFDPEICGFIEKMLEAEGVTSVPAILRFAVQGQRTDPLNHLADDPEMYEAFSLRQSENKAAVEETLRENLGYLLDQLMNLPLVNGDTTDLVSRLRTALTKG